MFPFVFFCCLDIFHINIFSSKDAVRRFNKPAHPKNLSLSVFDAPGAPVLHKQCQNLKRVISEIFAANLKKT